jgi:hypothetical protein
VPAPGCTECTGTLSLRGLGLSGDEHLRLVDEGNYGLSGITEFQAVSQNYYITGPGNFNFDMSIIRNFAITGSQSLQFRLEVFNTFNQPV